MAQTGRQQPNMSTTFMGRSRSLDDLWRQTPRSAEPEGQEVNRVWLFLFWGKNRINTALVKTDKADYSVSGNTQIITLMEVFNKLLLVNGLKHWQLVKFWPDQYILASLKMFFFYRKGFLNSNHEGFQVTPYYISTKNINLLFCLTWKIWADQSKEVCVWKEINTYTE